MSVTKEEIEAMFAERDAKSEAMIVGTLKGFTEQFGTKIDQTINGAIGRLEKESNIRIEGLTSKLDGVTKFQTELQSALEAPDPDPVTDNPTPTPPQNPDLDRLIDERIKGYESKLKSYEAKLNESSAKQKALEETVDAERKEKTEMAQKRVEADRDSSFLDILKKVAPKVNLYDNHEDLAFERLRKDQRLQASEDGKSWLIKAKQKNSYTGQEEDLLISPDENSLTSLISQDYTMYLKPRGGVGSNATPTQSYRQPSNKNAAELLDGINSNGDLDLDAISQAIANS